MILLFLFYFLAYFLFCVSLTQCTPPPSFLVTDHYKFILLFSLQRLRFCLHLSLTRFASPLPYLYLSSVSLCPSCFILREFYLCLLFFYIFLSYVSFVSLIFGVFRVLCLLFLFFCLHYYTSFSTLINLRFCFPSVVTNFTE